MRRVLIALLVTGLAAGLLAAPAAARKKKKPKPVQTTMYMHGTAPLGEVDGVQWFADNTNYTTMDGVEPTDPAPKSMNFFSPALNDQCTGLPLAFPTFVGDLQGTIKGDAKLALHFASAPGTVTARIWADIAPFSQCNDAYVAPASEVQFDVPAGQNEVEVVFEKLNLKATSFIMVEILVPSGPAYGGQIGRLLYDSTATPTSIEFGCVPAAGTSCLPG
jgi:hypothetical protein